MKIGLSKKCLDCFLCDTRVKNLSFVYFVFSTVVLIFTVYTKLNLMRENKHNFDRHSDSQGLVNQSTNQQRN
jgi:hypothetical protein